MTTQLVPNPAGLLKAAAFLLVLLTGLHAATPQFVDATPADNFKLYWLVKTETPPAIDGKLDDAAWKAANPLEDWGICNYGRQVGALGKIDFRACWDDQYLYLGARMYHDRRPEDMAELRRQVGNISQAIYARECVEIHIDGNLDHATTFQAIVNPLGEKMMLWHYDFGWGLLDNPDYGLDADWDVAAAIEEKSWTFEIRIALADIQVQPKVGYQFGINPCWFNWADSRENGNPYWWQFETWSTHGDSHHDPRLYGRFILVDKRPADLTAGLRLAFPDLDQRRLMIQTDKGYLVFEDGKSHLVGYDVKVREEAKSARELLTRVKELLDSGKAARSAYLSKTVVPEQEKALVEIEAKLTGKPGRGELSELRRRLGEVTTKLNDAWWRASQDALLSALPATP